MKNKILSFVLVLGLPLSIMAQKEISIIAHGLGNQTFISKNKDSISIKGLENIIDIELLNSNDSIQYQLVGYDSKIFHSQYPKIRYTNLIGGQYELKYRLSSEQNFKLIHINIEEAIWQKWWFVPMIVFYVLLLAGIGFYMFFLYNYRQKMKMEQLRNKIAADLHDEVGSNLSSIAIFTELLRKKLGNQMPDVLPILEKIKGNSKDSVSLMQDTVWAIKPGNDSVNKLLDRINAFGREVLISNGIGYNTDLRSDPEKLNLDMETRKNIFLILKEGINNIAKHSQATEAVFSIYQDTNATVLELKDNGIGFDLDSKTEGNGLYNFKNRAEDSNLKFELDSEKNKGTVLRIYLA